MKQVVLALIIIAAFVTGCGGAEPQQNAPTATQAPLANTEFDRRAMIAEIVNELILPLHAQLVDEVSALEAAVEQLAEDPTPETLAAAQRAMAHGRRGQPGSSRFNCALACW